MIELKNILGGGGHAVAAQDLAVELKAEFDRISGDEESGGLMSVSQLASSCLRQSAESVYRRLYEIRAGRNRTVNAELAEAITLAVGEWHLTDLNIPTFPRSMSAAVESVEAWAEIHGTDDPELNVLKLAEKLLRFTIGYVSTFEDVETAIAEAKGQGAAAELVAA